MGRDFQDWRNEQGEEAQGKTALEIVEAIAGVSPGNISVFSGSSILSVKNFGAAGDGTTDDTAAIQDAIDAIPNTGGALFFPEGTYKITDELVIPNDYGFRIIGANWQTTRILQYASDTPILNFTSDALHSLSIENLYLEYNTQQTSSHTDSYAVAFTGTSLSYSGVYHSQFRNLWIRGAYVGIGINNGGNPLPVWNCVFETIKCFNIIRSGLHIDGIAGQPVNLFSDIGIFNPNDASVVNTGAAIEIQGDYQISGLDVEGWENTVLYCASGNGSINNAHIEWHRTTTAYPTLLDVANGTFEFTELNIALNLINDSYTRIVSADAAKVHVSGVRAHAYSTVSVGPCFIVSGDASDSQIVAERFNCVDPTVIFNWPTTGYGAGLDAVSSYNGLPPIRESGQSLPTASANYQGRMWLKKGAAGVLDGLWACVKLADDSYSWNQLMETAAGDARYLKLTGGTLLGNLNGGIINLTNYVAALSFRFADANWEWIRDDAGTYGPAYCLVTSGGGAGERQFIWRDSIEDLDKFGAFIGALSAASGNEDGFFITPKINQSGTAGYRALNVDVTEAATGSGRKLLLRLARGGSEKFNIDRDGQIQTANAAAATTPGSVVKKLEIFDAAGASLGFIPIYDSIS